MTPYENHNIVSSQLGKWLGAKTTIARIDNPEFLSPEASNHFRSLGIDRMVNPEYLVAREICISLGNVWMRSLHKIAKGELCICSVKLSEPSPILFKSIAEFGQITQEFHVALIKRNGESIIPGGSHSFERNDIVYFTFRPGSEKRLGELCGKTNREIKRVIITGTGKIAETVCGMIPDLYGVKVIEPDREKCLRFADSFPSVTVVNADFRDINVQREEGIRDNCAFLALGDSSETNIVSATVAKHIGALKTIAQVEDTQYFDEVQALDIDTVVNKKLLTSSRIYQFLIDSVLDSPRCLAFEDTDVLEIVAQDSSMITRHNVRDLKLSSDMTIAGLTRGGHGMLVNGDSRIEPGDHVVVFSLHGTLRKVERLFR